MKKAAVLFVSTAMSFAVVSGVATAQSPTGRRYPVKRQGTQLTKIGSGLAELFEEHSRAQASGAAPARNPQMRVRQDLVLIDAVASGGTEALRSELESLGGQGLKTFHSTVSGWFPIDALGDLGALGSLQFARHSVMKTNAGLVTSQGDVSMRADEMRSTFGVDGSGVTVGTMSDSFNSLGGAATDVANGDLPSGISVLEDMAGSDEGRAMMQVIADVAPGASQAFHTASGGMADFALGVEELAGCPAGSEPGCVAVGGVAADVIIDDTTYLSEPMFQDGIIAQAVEVVKNAGVAYFSAAGNLARNSFETELGFVPSATLGEFDGPLHDFDPGAGDDPYQSVTIPVGATVSISFQWDSPFFSVSGTPGSPNDLDIWLTGDGPGITTVVAFSTDFNVGADPVEVFSFFNDGSTDIDGVAGPDTMFNLSFEKYEGAEPGRLKYVFDGPMTVNEFATSSGTIFGHAAAAGARAVGAAGYDKTPEFGTSPPLLQPYSASGPATILFDPSGSPVLDVRAKPEIVAPDGANNTFFGADGEPDGFPNFFGTSAAAAHAAGLAALLLEADTTLTLDRLYNTLATFAIDMNGAGFDFDTGFGLVQAPTSCLLDAFEPDSTPGEAATIVGGVTQSHSICPLADEDWATFSLIVPSQVVLETSGLAGNTRMWLREAGLSQIEFDDDDGQGSFSLIDRVCGVDELPAGTFFVEIDELNDDETIPGYSLDLSVTPCCVTDLVVENQTLSGTLTLSATATATLGPNVIIDGADIAINAPLVSILGSTEIRGTFSIGNTPVCP